MLLVKFGLYSIALHKQPAQSQIHQSKKLCKLIIIPEIWGRFGARGRLGEVLELSLATPFLGLPPAVIFALEPHLVAPVFTPALVAVAVLAPPFVPFFGAFDGLCFYGS